jgi:hypothetical protein
VKRCNKCHIDKDDSFFYRHKRDGLRSRCKQCELAYKRNHKYTYIKKKQPKTELEKFMDKRLNMIRASARKIQKKQKAEEDYLNYLMAVEDDCEMWID